MAKESDFSFVADKHFFPSLRSKSLFAEARLVFWWRKVLLIFSHPLLLRGGPVDTVQNLFRPVRDVDCLPDGKVVPSVQNQKET